MTGRGSRTRITARVIRRLRRGIIRLPIAPLRGYRSVMKPEVLGLCYHVISDVPVPHVDSLFPHKSSQAFERQLVYLKEHFQLLTYEELTKLRNQHRKNAAAVFVSFDDGLSECYEIVRPVLIKHSIPCLFFVSTDFIDNVSMSNDHKIGLCRTRLSVLSGPQRDDAIQTLNSTFHLRIRSLREAFQWLDDSAIRDGDGVVFDECCEILGIDVGAYLRRNKPYLTTEQIKQLVREGFVVGAHGRSHVRLAALSPADQEAEIASSCAIVRDLTGTEKCPFAFPYSGDGVSLSFLYELKAKYPFLGLFFDLGGFWSRADFVVNRIWCESPLLSPSPASSMPAILRNAFQNVWIEKFFA